MDTRQTVPAGYGVVRPFVRLLAGRCRAACWRPGPGRQHAGESRDHRKSKLKSQPIWPVQVPPKLISKLPVTVLSAVMTTVQVPVPEQAPPKPVKTDPLTGVAVMVTEVRQP